VARFAHPVEVRVHGIDDVAVGARTELGLLVVDGDRWQLQWAGGAGADVYKNPDAAAWNANIISPCVKDSDRPERLVYMISGPHGFDVAAWVIDIEAVVINIRNKFPTVLVIALQPVVGALLRAPLASEFTLTRNGSRVPVTLVKHWRADPSAALAALFESPLPAAPAEYAPDIISKLEGAKMLHGVEGGAGSSLKSEQKRTLHVRATCPAPSAPRRGITLKRRGSREEAQSRPASDRVRALRRAQRERCGQDARHEPARGEHGAAQAACTFQRSALHPVGARG
jgi:hypothetical protein